MQVYIRQNVTENINVFLCESLITLSIQKNAVKIYSFTHLSKFIAKIVWDINVKRNSGCQINSITIFS